MHWQGAPCRFDSFMHVEVRHVGDVVIRAVPLNKSTHFILVTESQIKARQAILVEHVIPYAVDSTTLFGQEPLTACVTGILFAHA